MVYDQSVNTSEINAPVQANIVTRSQAGQTLPKSIARPTKTVSTYNGQRIDINKMTSFLANVTRQTSTRMCARGVRLALQAAGAKFQSHPVAAADWGSTLLKIGYRKINTSFDRPQKGDIYIIDRSVKNRYGHIAAYSGSAWVSDFKQRSHAVYKNQKVNYQYYRLAL